MLKSLSILAVLCLLGGATAGLITDHPRAVLWSLAIVVPPALLTFAAVAWLSRRWPAAAITAVAASTMLRMGVALIATVKLSEEAKIQFGDHRVLAEWTVGLYLVTLLWEVLLLAWQLHEPRRQVGSRP